MLKVKAETREIGPDHIKRIEAALKKTHGSYVDVGWPEGQKYPGEDVTVAQVALFNEMGTYTKDHLPHTPARPFIRPAIDENKQKLEQLRLDSITKFAFLGVDAETCLREQGEAIKAMIVAKINSNVPPPNAPSTIARKQALGRGETTLVDTGLMRDSITVTVVLNDVLQVEKEEAEKLAKEQAASAAKKAQRRAEYRAQAQEAKARAREAKGKAKDALQAQRSAQKSVKAQTKKAGKAIRKAGKNVKRTLAKKQKEAGRNIKKGVTQVQKTVKSSVRSVTKAASKGIRSASKRISGKSARRTRSKPDSTDKG